MTTVPKLALRAAATAAVETAVLVLEMVAVVKVAAIVTVATAAVAVETVVLVLEMVAVKAAAIAATALLVRLVISTISKKPTETLFAPSPGMQKLTTTSATV